MAGMARVLPSITARLIVGLTVITTLVWCGAVAYSTVNSYRELNEAFDQTLQEAARRLLPLASDDVLGHEQDDAIATHDFIEGRKDYLSYQLSDEHGRILLRSEDAPPEPFAQARQEGFSTVGSFRLFTTTDEMRHITITVAETTEGRWHAVIASGKAMLWPLLALIPFNVLGIWLTVRGAMRPVLRLSADIAKRSGANLAPLDIRDQPAELRPIAVAAARLVGRLKSALDAERALAANSAHELRTPIAGALAQTQRMIAQLDDPADRARARDIETTLKRLSVLAEKLMQLSRADAGFGASERSVDLMTILDLVISDCARHLARPERIRYSKAPDAVLQARMDIDAFAIAIRNLVDNAMSHGAEGAPVEVMVETGGIVRVVNDGEVVPPQVLEELKRRFYRGASRAPGSGLGLSIVEMVMAQSGGEVQLYSPPPGRTRGFEARLVMGR
jgi:two-component system OmpR family sensor kinase